MYTIKIKVLNHKDLITVAKVSFKPSDTMLYLMLKEYAEYAILPVESILIYNCRKLYKP